jgi:hypothetical protein
MIDLELVDVGVHRNEIVGKVVIDVPSSARVDLCRFVQCRADALDHAAYILAARRARVQDAGSGESADDTRHANFAGERVDAHLHELGTGCLH